MDSSDWSSLEVAKLVVAALTPVLVFALGIVLTRLGRRIEDAQWAGRKLIERRLALYDEMAPRLNDLLCFFLAIGHFRAITPELALTRKRELDKAFHVNRYLMGEEFGARYQRFIQVCFKHFVAAAQGAHLRASRERQRRERRPDWQPSWDELFVRDPGDVTPPAVVQARYEELMESFSRELGVRHSDEPERRGVRPASLAAPVTGPRTD